jgi:hypothetical protein
MMVRIFLILSMLCAGGSLYLSHDKVQARKNKVEDDRQKAESARDKAIQDRKNKEKEEADKLAEHNSVSNQWYGVTLQITNKMEQVASMTKVIETHSKAEARFKKETESIISDSPEWFALNTTAAKVRQQRDRLPKAEVELATTQTELEVIGRDNTRLKNTLIKLKPTGPQELPEGLAGKIVAFDPRYQYVVLNVGGNHGVLMDGRLVIKRGDEILGQARITRVEDEYAVANVLQEFVQGDVAEGDDVVYQGKAVN